MMTLDLSVVADGTIRVSYAHPEALSLECCLTWLCYVFREKNLLPSCTSFGLLLTLSWGLHARRGALTATRALDFGLLLAAASPTSSASKPLIKHLILNKLNRLHIERHQLMDLVVILLCSHVVFHTFPNLLMFEIHDVEQIFFHESPDA